MKPFTAFLFIILFLVGLFPFSVLSNFESVRDRVNQIQNADLGLPSGVSEPKGIFGTIIANLFDASAKIKAEFLTNLASGVATNNIPRWNGSTFVNSNLSSDGTYTNFNGGNRLVGDNNTALTYYSNNTTSAQIPVRDNDGTLQGSLYGEANGQNFGLLDGDEQWSYLGVKDAYTEMRINNSSILRLYPSMVGISPSQLQIGWNRTGNRGAYTTYIGDDTYTNYGLLVERGATGPDTYSQLVHRGAGDFVMSANDAGTLEFRTNGADRMIIAPTTGNIGIGGAATTDKLAVTGNIAATGDIKAARLCNAAGASCVSLPLTAGNIDGAGSANKVARFSDADTLSTGVITDNGTTVGIGGAPNGHRLYVAGDTNTSGWFRTTGNGGWYSETWDGGLYMSDSTWIRTHSNDGIWTNNGVLGSQGGLTVGYGGAGPNMAGGAVIAGNVGIGTSTPGYKLDVNGDTRTNRLRLNGGYGLYSEMYRNSFSPLDSNYWYMRDDYGMVLQNLSGNTKGYVYFDGPSGGSFGLLASDGNWNFRTWAGQNSELYGVAYANDFRPYIIYDRNDTSYYVDPASTSRLNALYSTIMYDTNDGNYYVDPNGTTRLSTLYNIGYQYENNTSPSIVFQDSDNRSAVIHVNSNQFYVLSGNGVNGTSRSINGSYWPLQIDMNNDWTTFGGNVTLAEGNLYTSSMYDTNDTNYYVDPNGTSRLNETRAAKYCDSNGNNCLVLGGGTSYPIGSYIFASPSPAITINPGTIVLGSTLLLAGVASSGFNNNSSIIHRTTPSLPGSRRAVGFCDLSGGMTDCATMFVRVS